MLRIRSSTLNTIHLYDRLIEDYSPGSLQKDKLGLSMMKVKVTVQFESLLD